MGSYTVNMPKQAGWLVYINGLEIPVMSVSTSFGVWKIPTATIDLVPHPLLNRIGAEDRLQVAVFYLDHHWSPKNPTFRLLAEYEVVGWSYRNTPRARSITLSCVSQLQIFEQLRFYFISSVTDAIAGMGPEKKTSGDVVQAVKILYPASLFREGLTNPIRTKNAEGEDQIDSSAFIKRPIDFVLNIFRALLAEPSPEEHDVSYVDPESEYVPKSATSVPGKNFFARWLKMTGFHRRWAAFPLLEDHGGDGCFPIVKATQDTTALPALQQQVGESAGAAGTAWQLLQKVFGYMYMEVCVIPAPAAAVTAKGSGDIKPPWGSVDAVGKTEIASIPTFVVKPMCTFAMPPSCNVVFPSMINQYQVQETYITQPTRVYLGEQFISSVIAPDKKDSKMHNFLQSLMITGYPIAVRTRMQTLIGGSPETSNKNFLLFPEEFYKGPNSRHLNAPPWMFMLQQKKNADDDAKKSKDEEELHAEIDAAVTLDLENDLRSGLGGMFDAYAKYEYYRARYAERTGGVALLWNPYVVPGFPMAVFDQKGSGFDTIGYANTVNHSMSATGNMTTSVNLSFLRSMPEFVGMTAEQDNTQDLELDIAPAEVIPEVRDLFQRAKTAHKMYRRLFYQDAPMKKSAVFDWKAMLDLTDIYGGKLDPDKDAYRIDEAIQLTPKKEFEGLFEGYDAAMQYASRPACSLKEYIETHHGRSLSTLVADGTVRGEYTSFYSPTNDEEQNRGAVFWGRIYGLTQGPGSPPPVTVTNVGPGPDYESVGGIGWKPTDTSQMPQTRDNWAKKLEEYRKIVRGEDGRISPQV